MPEQAQERSEPVPLEPELARFLAGVGDAVQAQAGDNPTIDQLRAAARAARLEWAQGGSPLKTRSVDGLGMPARLYEPVGPPPWPVLIYLHGGGWTMLDLDTHDRLMRAYARASGWAVLGLDYPLAPETQYPTTVFACADAIDRLLARTAEYGLRTDAIVIGGDSSGANLALAAELHRRHDHLPPLRGLLLNYGVFDCDLHRPSYAAFSGPPFLLGHERMAFFWDNYCPQAERRPEALASPLNTPLDALAQMPPVHMTIAAQDVLVDENHAMTERLRRAGVALSTHLAEDAPHGFLEAVDQSPAAERAIAETALWLRSLADEQTRP